MAVMTPSTPPADEGGKQAERAAYQAFESQLSDEFYVYHSLELLDDELAEGEIDFLIAHRELGLLVVECKGGGVKREPGGQWVRWYGGERTPMKKSPWSQARGQQYSLVSQLADRMSGADGSLSGYVDGRSSQFPLAFGHAAAFPLSTTEQANLPLEADEKTFFDASAFDDIERHVRAAFESLHDRYDKETFDEDEFRSFREEILYPETTLVEMLGAKIQAEGRQFERLTDEQTKILRHVLGESPLVVRGGAGTGKTMLAVEAARQFADWGDRVLLTCFNKKLAEVLRERIEDAEGAAGQIRVAHFHGLCAQAVNRVDGYDFPDDGASRDEKWTFFNEEAPLALMEALESGSMTGWDAIVVDEGQDFHGEWWDVLAAGYGEESERRCVIFEDPQQNIFGREGQLREEATLVPLTTNLRNTREISAVLNSLSSDQMVPDQRVPRGEPPTVQPYNSREGELKALNRLVSRLVGEERVSPSQMAILTPRTRKNSVLAGQTEVGGYQLTDELAKNRNNEGVLHSTIGGFKGLEREVIILADVDPDHERCNVNARYVAASRAINRLYVFEESNWLADVDTS
jgi:hypothetical protein